MPYLLCNVAQASLLTMQVYDFRELSALFADSLAACQVDIRLGSGEMHSLLASSAALLGVAPASPKWQAYVEHVAGIVVRGLADMLLASLRYLQSQVLLH